MRALWKLLWGAGVLFILLFPVLLALSQAEQPRDVPVALQSDAQLVLLHLEVSDSATIMLGDDCLSWDQFRRLDLTTVRVQYLHLSWGKVKDIRLERR